MPKSTGKVKTHSFQEADGHKEIINPENGTSSDYGDIVVHTSTTSGGNYRNGKAQWKVANDRVTLLAVIQMDVGAAAIAGVDHVLKDQALTLNLKADEPDPASPADAS